MSLHQNIGHKGPVKEVYVHRDREGINPLYFLRVLYCIVFCCIILYCILLCCVVLYCKGDAIQLQPWKDPEGSRSLRLQNFKTIGT